MEDIWKMQVMKTGSISIICDSHYYFLSYFPLLCSYCLPFPNQSTIVDHQQRAWIPIMKFRHFLQINLIYHWHSYYDEIQIWIYLIVWLWWVFFFCLSSGASLQLVIMTMGLLLCFSYWSYCTWLHNCADHMAWIDVFKMVSLSFLFCSEEELWFQMSN